MPVRATPRRPRRSPTRGGVPPTSPAYAGDLAPSPSPPPPSCRRPIGPVPEKRRRPIVMLGALAGRRGLLIAAGVFAVVMFSARRQHDGDTTVGRRHRRSPLRALQHRAVHRHVPRRLRSRSALSPVPADPGGKPSVATYGIRLGMPAHRLRGDGVTAERRSFVRASGGIR